MVRLCEGSCVKGGGWRRPTASWSCGRCHADNQSAHCDHCSGASQRHCDLAILCSPNTRRLLQPQEGWWKSLFSWIVTHSRVFRECRPLAIPIKKRREFHCVELPPRHFLRKSTSVAVVGNALTHCVWREPGRIPALEPRAPIGSGVLPIRMA